MGDKPSPVTPAGIAARRSVIAPFPPAFLTRELSGSLRGEVCVWLEKPYVMQGQSSTSPLVKSVDMLPHRCMDACG